MLKVKYPLIELQSQNGLVYPGIDLNPKTGQLFADMTLGMNQKILIIIVSSYPMSYLNDDIYVPSKGKGQYRT